MGVISNFLILHLLIYPFMMGKTNFVNNNKI